MTLAEILDEGERREGVRVAAAQHRDYSGGVAAEGNLIDFYIRNGVRLLAVARAAVEAERLATIVQRHYITAPPDADSTAWTQRAWNAAGEADEAIERLFAAVRGAAGENGGK